MTKQALIVIDIQNDYFPNGKYPLWNSDATLNNILQAIETAQHNAMEVIVVQHIAQGEHAPFFVANSEGVELHSRLLAVSPDSVIITKHSADSFWQTDLDAVLTQFEVQNVFVAGMMTQNCITHTALSKTAEKYQISILKECCTTVDEMLNNIALNALSTRVPLLTTEEMVSRSPNVNQ